MTVNKATYLTKLHRELFFYMLVGGCAFAVHFLSVYLFVQWGVQPLVANIYAFLIAFNVSFWGHHHLTFAGHQVAIKQALWRLLMMATINFLINEYGYYLLLNIFHLHYLVALMLNLTIIAVFSFMLSKFWVFKAA